MREDSVNLDSVKVSKKVSKRNLGFEEGKEERGCPSGPKGPKEARQEASQKPESGPAAPSVDPSPILRSLGREVTRSTPRNHRAWQYTPPDTVAADEAKLERYRAAATGASS